MKSTFIEFLKLTFSEKYEISDKEYKTLSDILLSKGLEKSVYNNGLIQVLDILISHDCDFPVSVEYLKSLWEEDGITFNFVAMLLELVKSGMISMKKVSKASYFKQEKISKLPDEEDKDTYIVIYGTQNFKEVLDGFRQILYPKRSEPDFIQEGVSLKLPKKYQDLLIKTSKLLSKLNIVLQLESYDLDEALNTLQLNMVFSQTSDYTLRDTDILRFAKKYVKGRAVSEVETYKEGRTEIFLGVLLDLSQDYKSLPEGIYFFLEALEVEGGIKLYVRN